MMISAPAAFDDDLVTESGARSPRAHNGMTTVARAIALKPWLAYSALPSGAPSAKAAYSDVTNPSHDPTGVFRTKQLQTPAQCPGDDEAIRHAEQSASHKQNCNRHAGLSKEGQRNEEEHAAGDRAEQPRHDCPFRAGPIGITACWEAR